MVLFLSQGKKAFVFDLLCFLKNMMDITIAPQKYELLDTHRKNNSILISCLYSVQLTRATTVQSTKQKKEDGMCS